MTELRIPVDQFERGDLPPVCVASGRPSNGRVTFHYTNPIGWAWLLLLFPPGFVLFIIVVLLRSKSAKGDLPVDRAVWERYTAFRRRSRSAWAVYWVSVLAAVTAAFLGRDSTDPAHIGLLLTGAIIGAFVVQVRWGITSMVPGELEQSGRWLALQDVHPEFARAYHQHAADRLAGHPT